MADLADLVPFVLENARYVGPALVLAALLVRAFLRLFSIVLFAAGLVIVGYFAFQEWQISHDLLIAGAIFGVGFVLSGILSWAARSLSLVISLVFLAAGWYLLIYGWMGPEVVASSLGLATWAGVTALSGFVVGRLHGWRRVGLAVKAAAAAAAL